jgi:4'-phosphopantetheinyl transferase
VSPQVHVWYALTEQLDESVIAGARDLLSPAECARCDRFHFERDRRDFAAAHALLRRALTVHGDLSPAQWVFEHDALGKPFLAPGQLTIEFNLAHTNGLVACVLSNAGLVGVDVEQLDRAVNGDEVADRYFSSLEIHALRALTGVERQARFIELWTLKEAYLKAIGAGLSNPLNDFGFDLNGTSALRFNAPPGSSSTGWRFALFAPSARHRMAVAVRSDRDVVYTVRRWPAEASVTERAVRMSSD